LGTKNATNSTPVPLSFQVGEVMHFHKVESIASNFDGRQRLYVPTDPNNPAWDCIYHDGNTIAFFQFSISPFWNGHDRTVRASFDGGICEFDLID
jgi:hypothetical protein